ncbi:MAG: hypothetical protein FWD27_07415 [Coriobacteriia bacterium]|nr:hypothetical protein [Coriobacteriia bacterium]
MEFFDSLLSHQVANIIFLALFVGGLGLAIISVIFGNITDAVGGVFDGLDGVLDFDGDGFGWISFTTICIGISGTGAGGFLFNSLKIAPIFALLLGLIVGALCAFCAGRFIIVPLKRKQHSGVSKPEEAVGKTAAVIAPMTKGAMGEVMVEGKSYTARPVSSDLVFASGDLARVERVEGTIAFVDKMKTEEVDVPIHSNDDPEKKEK